jgi:hypothetical protein
VNGNQNNDNAIDSGAAYVFTISTVGPPDTGTPLAISTITRAPNGDTRLSLPTEAGRAYTLQVSEDLIDWIDRETATAVDELLEFAIPRSEEPQQFYRVKRN